MLSKAGITVSCGLLRARAYRLTQGHILRVSQRRPFVQLKLALGADGSVPRGTNGQPVWVTGPAARAHGHLMRARTDAIMVGHGTARDDDPELTCRLPGLEARSPVRVVLSTDATLSLNSKLVTGAHKTPLWLVCATDADQSPRAALVAAGIKIMPVDRIDGRLWLPAICEALVAAGITRLLVEGGPSLWRAFSDAGLVDEAVLFQGRSAHQPIETAAAALARHIDTSGLNVSDERPLADDRMVVFRRRVSPDRTLQPSSSA
jgi:diaminohydroxyphosphoribosylaminopyrimidine deaminase/5-amino-6-(5-phosphoribosylamino)uracil reductase